MGVESITVVKRDGSSQPFKLSEIRKKIEEVSVVIPESKRVELSQEIEVSLNQYIKNNIKTSDIQMSLIKCIADFIDIDKPYMEYAAAVSFFQKIYHEVYKVTGIKVYNDGINNYDRYNKLAFKEYLEYAKEKQLLSPVLYTKYSLEEIEELSKFIDYSMDKNFKYIGILTLYQRYLLRVKSHILEVPQWRFMSIAMFVASNEVSNRIEVAKKYYKMISSFNFMPATPTLNNGGKIRHQLSSCFVAVMDDNIESIFESITEFAMYSKYGGGEGIDVTKVRCKSSSLQGKHSAARGVIPWIKMLNNTAVSVDQVNTRPGSIAIYLQLWHADIMDFLKIRRNSGDDRERARDIFPGVSIPDLFMKRLDEGGKWSVFDPYEHPELVESYGEDFERLYELAEQSGSAIATYDCIEVWRSILEMYFETGMPFINFKDTMNRANRHPEEGFIHSSNLCCFTGDTKVVIWNEERNNYEIRTIEDLAPKLSEEVSGNIEYNKYVVPTYDKLVRQAESINRYAKAFLSGYKAIIEVVLDNGSSFKCTKDHILFTVDELEVKAKDSLNAVLYTTYLYSDIDKYDEVRDYYINKKSVKVIDIIDNNESEYVYDLEVEETHKFVILPKVFDETHAIGVVVHNCEISLPNTSTTFATRVTLKDGSYKDYPHDTYVDEYKCKSNVITKFHNDNIDKVETVISKVGETAVCNLGSINLLNYYKLDKESRQDLIYSAVRFLNSVIDMNLYVTPQSEVGAKKTRAIGLGVMNEHGLLANQQIMFGSTKHKEFIEDLYRELAEFSDRGSELLSEDSKTRINKYVRAPAPTGSISLITGCTQGIEPIYKRKWNEENSVGINPVLVPNINPDTFNYYISAYDIDLEDLVDLTAIRQKYVDQSISFTLYIDPTRRYVDKDTGNELSAAGKVSKAIKRAWRSGVKTLYYLRSKSPELTSKDSSDGNIIHCEGCQ